MGIRSFLTSRRKRSNSFPNTPHSNPIFETFDSRTISTTTHIKELEQVFGKFDTNGDGKISWSELGSIMASLGQESSEEELQKMVREADSDGDGFIDLDEFIELNTKGVDHTSVLEDLRDAFLVFDLDRNGSISPEELQRVFKSLGDDLSVAECRMMISGVDCDGDGLISFEEFKIMMLKGDSEIVKMETQK